MLRRISHPAFIITCGSPVALKFIYRGMPLCSVMILSVVTLHNYYEAIAARLGSWTHFFGLCGMGRRSEGAQWRQF